MAHSLTVPISAASPCSPVIPGSRKNVLPALRSDRHLRICCSATPNDDNSSSSTQFRREFMYAVFGATTSLVVGPTNANAARRPPPPPPAEKKDPSLTALQAKVLANKKRKEAMKAATAKERERGKAISE